ncbi:helix-turn-helix transcriptional regulator [Saccharopolyspora sp. NPDC047091]|uniref:helix-turn-helix domain-containing protein n=1 Tax=Saccharopolyspora sp. NPDC047091 TaxID=3155924 RepID=UPI0033DB10FE
MSNSPRARALAAEVRKVRKDKGMSQGVLAEQLGWSIAKISRIETAQRGIGGPDLAAVLAALRVRGKRREQLLTMAEELGRPSWWEAMAGLSAHTRACIDAEQRASRLTELSLGYVPVLLQTRAYATAVCAASGAGTGEVDEQVNVRQVRQGILHKASPVSFTAYLDESVLARPVGGPAVSAGQLRHLLRCAEAPNIAVRVLPTNLGVHAGLGGPFTVIEFARGVATVLLESQECGLLLDDEERVAAFRESVDCLDRVALGTVESRAVIGGYATKFEDRSARQLA